MEVVGSSQGWLVLKDRTKHMYLVDPTTHRDIALPPLPDSIWCEQVHSVLLSSSDDFDFDWERGEGKGKIFITFGSGQSLAFCAPPLHEWTLLGGSNYASVLYLSTHRRLFCITSASKLEVWDVGGDSLRLVDNWEANFGRVEADLELTKLKYLVCEEESGKLYVVVRHVKHRSGSWLKKQVFQSDYKCSTLDFEVYEIDLKRQRLMKMEDSLGGLAMFIGINHPVAIKIESVVGVQPNSIYFSYDTRVSPYPPIYDCGEPSDKYDHGVFDYGKRVVMSLVSLSRDVHYPVWFTPPRHRLGI